MGDRTEIPIDVAASRRWSIDLALVVAIGLLLGFLGPFDSDRVPVVTRYAYWILCMVGCGVIGIAVDEGLRSRLPWLWTRVAVVSVIATPLSALFVLAIQFALFGEHFHWSTYQKLHWQVWPILLSAMAIRALAWRRAAVRIETRTIISPPLPEAEVAFRLHLSAKRRDARLIAIEAHDHYLKVHTDAGSELITLRFADALSELAHAHGWRIHRSWWVAASAVEAVRWRKGAGEMHLVGGLTAPVSRTYRPLLKEAGWL